MLDDEDMAQYSQPDVDMFSDRSRRAEEAQGIKDAKNSEQK
jgi:hypothetical protein